MQTQPLFDKTNLSPNSTDANEALRVVIAYNDLSSGKRAMRVITDLAKASGDAIEFQPLPWSFDLLADLDWRDVAAHDAVNADILIIVTGNTNPLPPVVGRWAEEAIGRKQGTDAAVVALLGPEENPDGAGSSRLQAIQTAAQRAGLEFFAPAPRHELDESPVRIHRRAGLGMPVLNEYLQHRLSTSRWGINE